MRNDSAGLVKMAIGDRHRIGKGVSSAIAGAFRSLEEPVATIHAASVSTYDFMPNGEGEWSMALPGDGDIMAGVTLRFTAEDPRPDVFDLFEAVDLYVLTDWTEGYEKLCTFTSGYLSLYYQVLGYPWMMPGTVTLPFPAKYRPFYDVKLVVRPSKYAARPSLIVHWIYLETSVLRRVRQALATYGELISYPIHTTFKGVRIGEEVSMPTEGEVKYLYVRASTPLRKVRFNYDGVYEEYDSDILSLYLPIHHFGHGSSQGIYFLSYALEPLADHDTGSLRAWALKKFGIAVWPRDETVAAVDFEVVAVMQRRVLRSTFQGSA